MIMVKMECIGEKSLEDVYLEVLLNEKYVLKLFLQPVAQTKFLGFPFLIFAKVANIG